MRIAVDLMQDEHSARSPRKPPQRASEHETVDCARETRVEASEFLLRYWSLIAWRMIKVDMRNLLPAQAHQYGVRRYAKDLQECFLAQVLCVGGVLGHAQAKRVDLGSLGMKQGRECVRIALLSALHEINVR